MLIVQRLLTPAQAPKSPPRVPGCIDCSWQHCACCCQAVLHTTSPGQPPCSAAAAIESRLWLVGCVCLCSCSPSCSCCVVLLGVVLQQVVCHVLNRVVWPLPAQALQALHQYRHHRGLLHMARHGMSGTRVSLLVCWRGVRECAAAEHSR